MTIAFTILGVTIAMFVFTRLRPDFVALVSLLALFLTGIIDVTEAFAGFADTTVILIAVLFVVGESISRTGFAAWLGQRMVQCAGSSRNRLLILMLIATATLSAFISNTGTVAMMVPIAVAAALRVESVPSKFLLPIAITANVAGALTLISTGTNIIVSDTLVDAGLPPFGFFEFTLIGLPLMIVTVVFIRFFGQHMLPEHAPAERPIDLVTLLGELATVYSLEGKLFWLRVLPGSDLVGQNLGQAALDQRYGVTVVRLAQGDIRGIDAQRALQRVRDGLAQLRSAESVSSLPGARSRIQADDMLLVKGEPQAVEEMTVQHSLGIEPIGDIDEQFIDALLSRELGLAEVVITPRSEYIGQTVREGLVHERFSVQVLGISRNNQPIDQRVVKLHAGDTLLVRGTWDAIGALRDEGRNFVVIGHPEAMAGEVTKLGPKAFVAISILLGMVFLMVTGWVPVVMAAFMAAIATVAAGIITLPQAYRSINWSVVVLIAALLPMGTALQKTGGAEFLAEGLVRALGSLGPLVVMGVIFVLASGFSQIISNTASAVLISPIALQAATELGIAPHPMMMMVALGVVTGILTPIAGAPMLIVMTPGGYSFGDYARVGLPLLIILFVVTMILVPFIWPL